MKEDLFRQLVTSIESQKMEFFYSSMVVVWLLPHDLVSLGRILEPEHIS
jgi:hypothetical protein